MTTTGRTTDTERRERRVLSSAVFISGAGEVTDFMLPLYAGSAIGLTPTWIGALLAVELAVSFVTRPLAGVLADRTERRTVAAAGALLYGCASAGYALAPGAWAMVGAAVIGGVGGSLLWVCLRAMAGERMGEDSGVFARLVSAEETGGWVVFVPAVFLVSAIDYRGVFWALAACCLVAAFLLASAPARHPRATLASTDSAEPGLLARLLPMLVATLVILTAEAVIGLLLLLHLQQEFGLGPVGIAYVFVPGGLALSILPPYLHGLVGRFGRTRMLALASVASALFAASLAFAPSPVAIALFWILAATSWAVVLPVQQAVIAEAAGPHRLGRGLGAYEAASLGGGFLGALLGGVLYDSGSWQVGCLVAAGIILTGAVLVPAAVRRLNVDEYPPARSHDDAPTLAPAELDREEEPTPQPDRDPPPEPKTRRELLTGLGIHTVLLGGAVAVSVLVVDGVTAAGVANMGDTNTHGPNGYTPDEVIDWVRGALRGDDGIVGLVTTALRIWGVVYLIDLIKKLVSLPKAPRPQRH